MIKNLRFCLMTILVLGSFWIKPSKIHASCCLREAIIAGEHLFPRSLGYAKSHIPKKFYSINVKDLDVNWNKDYPSNRSHKFLKFFKPLETNKINLTFVDQKRSLHYFVRRFSDKTENSFNLIPHEDENIMSFSKFSSFYQEKKDFSKKITKYSQEIDCQRSVFLDKTNTKLVYSSEDSQGISRKMKLISLNIWGGHVREPLFKFVESYQDVDIFCLQEVYNKASHKISTDDKEVNLNIFSELNDLLPNHNGYFRPVVDHMYGIGMLVKKDIEVVDEGEFKIYDNPQYKGCGPTHSRILQWLKFSVNNQLYMVINIHGLWNGQGKTDSPERLNQSRKIREFIDDQSIPKILCGDFNLRPDTESIKILEPNMVNLIQKYNVTSTRTSFYQKDEKFADYIFTSPEIFLNGFQVMQEVVSDHCPLLLDFVMSLKPRGMVEERKRD